MSIQNNECWYCGKQATVLCDGVLARQQGKGTPYTCDRPLCPDHVAHSGVVHFSGTKNGKRAGWTDTYDYCHSCVEEGRQFPGLGVPRVAGDTEGLAIQVKRLLKVVE